jgi:predicted ATPase
MQARSGVHSGEVLVRLINGELGPSYDVTGAAVHLSSRLESIAEPGSVLVSAATYTLALPYFDFVPRPMVVPKGFTQPVPVFSISGQRSISRWLARSGRDLSAFVGRDGEIQRLTEIAQRTTAGHGQAAVISGNAGAGKSRLAHEFIATLAKEGWAIIEAEAQSAGQPRPYGTLKRILLSWLGCSELESSNALAAALEQSLGQFEVPAAHYRSALYSILDLPVGDASWRESEPGFRRRYVVEALKLVMSSAAESVPLVLLLEDLQWVDGDSGAVINALHDVLPNYRLLILGTTRTYKNLTVNIGPEFNRFDLSPLERPAAGELLSALLGGGESLAGVKERLLEKTGGIPLFIEEVVRSLIDSGALVGARGAYSLAVSPEEVGIPMTVQAIISTRIDALSPNAKRVLQFAAVVGQPLTMPILSAMAEGLAEQLPETIREIEQQGFLNRTRTLPELEFAFAHELIREVTYSALVRDQRRRLHDKALTACMQVLSERLDEFASPLAHHAFESQNWKSLQLFARQAATRAIERSAFREAAQQYQRAIEAISKLPRNRELDELGIDTRLQSRLAFSATSQLSTWIEYARQAEELAFVIGDERRELAAVINRAQAMNFAGTPMQSIELAEPALHRARAAQVRDLELLAVYIIGQANYAAGRYQATADLLSSQMDQLRGGNALARFGTGGTTSVLFLIMIVVASASLGDADRSQKALEEAVGVANETGRPYDAVACSYAHGILLSSAGRTPEAIAEFRRGLELCREYSINLFIPLIVGQLGAALSAVGQQVQAIGLLEKVVREAESLGHNVGTVFANYALAAAYKASGRIAEAVALCRKSLESTRQYGYQGVETRLLLLLGNLELAADRPDLQAAEAYVRRSIMLASRVGALPNVAQGQLALADILAVAQRYSEASEILEAAVKLSGEIDYRFPEDEVSRIRARLASVENAP